MDSVSSTGRPKIKNKRGRSTPHAELRFVLLVAPVRFKFDWDFGEFQCTRTGPVAFHNTLDRTLEPRSLSLNPLPKKNHVESQIAPLCRTSGRAEDARPLGPELDRQRLHVERETLQVERPPEALRAPREVPAAKRSMRVFFFFEREDARRLVLACRIDSEGVDRVVRRERKKSSTSLVRVTRSAGGWCWWRCPGLV